MMTLTKLPPDVLNVADKQMRHIVGRATSDEQGNGLLEGIANKIGELDSYWTVAHPRSLAFGSEGIQLTVDKGTMLPGDRKSVV